MLGPKKIVCPKYCVSKNLGSIRNRGQKNFDSRKMLVKKNNCWVKNVGSQKPCNQKILGEVFLCPTNFGSKEIFVAQKFWAQNFFGPNKFESKSFWSKKSSG